MGKLYTSYNHFQTKKAQKNLPDRAAYKISYIRVYPPGFSSRVLIVLPFLFYLSALRCFLLSDSQRLLLGDHGHEIKPLICGWVPDLATLILEFLKWIHLRKWLMLENSQN